MMATLKVPRIYIGNGFYLELYPALKGEGYIMDVCSEGGSIRETALHAGSIVMDNPQLEGQLMEYIKQGDVPAFIDAENPDMALFKATVNAASVLAAGALDDFLSIEDEEAEDFEIYNAQMVDKYIYFIGEHFYADITCWDGVYQSMLRYVGHDAAYHVMEIMADNVDTVISQFMDSIVGDNIVSLFTDAYPECKRDYVAIVLEEYGTSLKRCEKLASMKIPAELLSEIGYLRGVAFVIKNMNEVALPCVTEYESFLELEDILLKKK